MKKGVLITGCTGFLGTNLVEELHEKYKLYGTSRVERNNPNIDIIKVDLTNTDFKFIDDLKNLKYVIHLAGFSSPSRSNIADIQDVVELNVNSTRQLLEKLKTKNLEKIVFMSSAAVYNSNGCSKEESPINNNGDRYSRSKLDAETICKDYINKGLPIVIFRLSNCYGPNQQWKRDEIPTIIPQFIMQSFEKNIHVLNRNILRDFVYVKDCVSAVSKSLESNYIGVLNLGSGKPTSTETLAKIISKVNNSKLTFFNEETKEKNISYLDISKIKKELDWKPKYSVEEGLKETIKFYKGIKK